MIRKSQVSPRATSGDARPRYRSRSGRHGTSTASAATTEVDMTDTGDTETNLVNTIHGLKKFDRSNPADFKAWMKKFCIAIGVTRRDILPLLKGEEKPTDTAKIADYSRANEVLYAMLYLLVELPAALCVQNYEDES